MNITAKDLANSGMTAEQIESVVARLTPKMQLVELTEEEIRLQGRDYNPRAWDEIIDRYSKQTTFYKRINSPLQYDEFFAVYTTNAGINIFNTVSYSSMLTSRGMVEVSIDEEGYVRTNEVYGGNGTYGRIDKTNPASYKYMAQMSMRGFIYTSVL